MNWRWESVGSCVTQNVMRLEIDFTTKSLRLIGRDMHVKTFVLILWGFLSISTFPFSLFYLYFGPSAKKSTLMSSAVLSCTSDQPCEPQHNSGLMATPSLDSLLNKFIILDKNSPHHDLARHFEFAIYIFSMVFPVTCDTTRDHCWASTARTWGDIPKSLTYENFLRLVKIKFYFQIKLEN